MKKLVLRALLLAAIATTFACTPSGNSPADESAAAAVNSLRLYVLDGGDLVSNPASYQLAEDEVQTSMLSIAAYLVVHPRGILLYDTFGVPDDERQPGGTGTQQTIVRSDKQERFITLASSLREQLAAAGYTPADVTHLALSHYHWDHSANANMFAHATWLVRLDERAEMFGTPSGSARPATYAALMDSPTVLVESDDYDVFGDGRVVLKAARGHSPGHQVLYLDLAQTGGVVLSGDLYHYPEERSLNRLPISEFNKTQTVAARQAVEEFLELNNAALWIGHDLLAHRRLKKSPDYYD